MPDPRFFKNKGATSLGELASLSGAELLSKKDATKEIVDVAPLNSAGLAEISFLDNPKYIDDFIKTNAGACITSRKYADRAPQDTALLISDNPYVSYALVARSFYPEKSAQKTLIDNSAIVDPGATIGKNCEIAAGSIIAKNVTIGDGCNIKAGVVISDGVEIGAGSTIHVNVSISHAIIGNNVTIHQGACIGQDGFGFATDEAGNHITVPQLGRVIIEDNVEIGAGTCIDRGSGPDTVIGEGTRIDNLVQIGHNVQLGKGCIIVSQVGVSGSTKLGDFVVAGGQVGFVGHINIGPGAQIAGQSGVMKNVPANAKMGGTPAVPLIQFHKQAVVLQNLTRKFHKDVDL